jgi:hypothetical protein
MVEASSEFVNHRKVSGDKNMLLEDFEKKASTEGLSSEAGFSGSSWGS